MLFRLDAYLLAVPLTTTHDDGVDAKGTSAAHVCAHTEIQMLVISKDFFNPRPWRTRFEPLTFAHTTTNSSTAVPGSADVAVSAHHSRPPR